MLTAPAAADRDMSAFRRAKQLINLHRDRTRERQIIRDICSGGERGLNALLGNAYGGDSRSVPAANMVLSGLTRLGQKIGRMPDLRVDLPPQADDSMNARKKAERIRRIVTAFDDYDLLEAKIARIGMWLPAYGFASFAIVDGFAFDGTPYPKIEARDPFNTFPGEFGVDEQPDDCAWVWQWTLQDLHEWGIKHERADILRLVDSRRRGQHGGVILEPSDTPVPTNVVPGVNVGSGYSQQGGGGITVVEYRNHHGCWLMLPDHGITLEHWPSPIKRPTFVVLRRHTLGELIGHYDHAIGLQSALVKMNTLALIALEDATFSETNIEGQILSGKYRRGRFAVNHLERGSQVSVPQRSIPYQYFQEIARMEQQFRTTVGYPVTDDAISPAAQATGQGIEKLHAPIDLEVKQYYDIIDRGLEMLDSSRLEWDETCYPDTRKTLVGQTDGQPYAEHYTPSSAIKGWCRTRRTHGAMAGLSESAKLVALLQLMGAGVIDPDTVREQLEGMGDVSQIKDRVTSSKVEDTLMQMMVSGAQVDPRVAMTLIEMLPEGKQKTTFRKFWTPQEPEMSSEEAMMLAGPPEQGPPMPAGPPPDAVTMLSRLTAGGPQGGVQTVSRGPM